MTPRERARKVAEIIMGDDVYIFTSYGRKSLEGLAELILDGMRENPPSVTVSADVADAFGMRGLPNTSIQGGTECERK